MRSTLTAWQKDTPSGLFLKRQDIGSNLGATTGRMSVKSSGLWVFSNWLKYCPIILFENEKRKTCYNSSVMATTTLTCSDFRNTSGKGYHYTAFGPAKYKRTGLPLH